MAIDDKVYPIDTAAKIDPDVSRTYLPIRALAEALDYGVDYEESSRTIILAEGMKGKMGNETKPDTKPTAEMPNYKPFNLAWIPDSYDMIPKTFKGLPVTLNKPTNYKPYGDKIWDNPSTFKGVNPYTNDELVRPITNPEIYKPVIPYQINEQGLTVPQTPTPIGYWFEPGTLVPCHTYKDGRKVKEPFSYKPIGTIETPLVASDGFGSSVYQHLIPVPNKNKNDAKKVKTRPRGEYREKIFQKGLGTLTKIDPKDFGIVNTQYFSSYALGNNHDGYKTNKVYNITGVYNIRYNITEVFYNRGNPFVDNVGVIAVSMDNDVLTGATRLGFITDNGVFLHSYYSQSEKEDGSVRFRARLIDTGSILHDTYAPLALTKKYDESTKTIDKQKLTPWMKQPEMGTDKRSMPAIDGRIITKVVYIEGDELYYEDIYLPIPKMYTNKQEKFAEDETRGHLYAKPYNPVETNFVDWGFTIPKGVK
jgi:hypothetical protein